MSNEPVEASAESRAPEHGRDDETGPATAKAPAATDHPTGEEQAQRNAEDEPAG